MAPPFIPYYIDYNVKNQSKTIGVSKKKITFKFGFANRQAVDEGMVGANCRGSEHECVFVWSLNSGKRHVSMDGKDVHFSTSGQNGWTADRTWQHVFSLKVPNYTGTFRCHLISQPAPQGTNMRPFDLRVGGVSIFKFNQIYMLGTPQMVVRKPGGGRVGNNGDDDGIGEEERRILARARLESMKEYEAQQARQGGNSTAPTGNTDLLMNFDAPPQQNQPPPSIPASGPPTHTVSSMTVGSDFNSSSNSFPAAPAPNQYAYPPRQQYQNGQAQYGQQPQLAQQQPQVAYGAPYASPAGPSTALTPYQSPPAQSQMPNPFAASTTTLSTVSSQASAPSVTSSMDPYSKPPSDPFASHGPPPPQQYSQPSPQYQHMQSPASVQTYGSAPSFARPSNPPPQQQQQQYQPQMAYGQPPTATYGAPPPNYAQQPPPPQYQQPNPGF